MQTKIRVSVTKTILAIIILLVLILNIKIYFMMKRFEKNMQAQEEKIKGYSLDAVKVGADLMEQVNPKLTDIISKLKVLYADSDAHAQAIENLTKAKNTLFDKTTSLELSIDNLKSEEEQLSSEFTALFINNKNLKKP
ncbi:MAG: hypothetical protein PHN57_03820 [Candidatus Omnitrophica bacterium]|nr:hypothetical protein [Candidatus Omnitrophota bacterium]